MGNVIIMFPLIELKTARLGRWREFRVRAWGWGTVVHCLLPVVIAFWPWPHQPDSGPARSLLPAAAAGQEPGAPGSLATCEVRRGAAEVVWVLNKERVYFTSQKAQVPPCQVWIQMRSRWSRVSGERWGGTDGHTRKESVPREGSECGSSPRATSRLIHRSFMRFPVCP